MKVPGIAIFLIGIIVMYFNLKNSNAVTAEFVLGLLACLIGVAMIIGAYLLEGFKKMKVNK
jgi:uncharacterized membrane protein HdeD (DUF308 family)